jgi:hypothetical protein
MELLNGEAIAHQLRTLPHDIGIPGVSVAGKRPVREGLLNHFLAARSMQVTSLLQWVDEQFPEQFSCSLCGQLLLIPATPQLHTECLEVEGLVVILHRDRFIHASVLGIIVHRVRDAIPAHESVPNRTMLCVQYSILQK